MPTDPRDFVPPKPETERLRGEAFAKWAEKLAAMTEKIATVAKEVKAADDEWSAPTHPCECGRYKTCGRPKPCESEGDAR